MPRINNSGAQYRYPYRAEAAVTGKRAVMAGTADGDVKMPTGANVYATGVAVEDQSTVNAPVEVVLFGPTICIAAGTCTRDQPAQIAGTSGKVQNVAGVSSGALAKVVGRFLQDAVNDGDEVAVWVEPREYQVP
jgi:hypothetical protein